MLPIIKLKGHIINLNLVSAIFPSSSNYMDLTKPENLDSISFTLGGGELLTIELTNDTIIPIFKLIEKIMGQPQELLPQSKLYMYLDGKPI